MSIRVIGNTLSTLLAFEIGDLRVEAVWKGVITYIEAPKEIIPSDVQYMR